ncbi:MAG: hypothetical protein KDA38_10645, partial [Planctomycetales bacterium]|nr:hypothetical protein [Planctomycetales bacterium]
IRRRVSYMRECVQSDLASPFSRLASGRCATRGKRLTLACRSTAARRAGDLRSSVSARSGDLRRA